MMFLQGLGNTTGSIISPNPCSSKYARYKMSPPYLNQDTYLIGQWPAKT